jgi:integrase
MFLLMATYGLGAGEVIRLRARDIDWSAKIIRVRRPKTGVCVELPLLQGVAKALAVYLQRGRPRHALGDQIFVTTALPHQGLTSGAIRHRVRKHARLAGVAADILGAHIFRHSHATRQIEGRVRPQIVSDILGHRDPSSISAYVRVALKRLRMVALPVPR